jgi:hypothetical protein
MRLLLSAAVIAGLFLTCIPGVVKAQGSLRLYADPAFTQCTLSDTAPGVVSVYVALTVLDADGVRFRVAASPGFTGVWLSDATPYYMVGSSPIDLGVGFNKCLSGRNLVATITYQLFGTSTCSELAIAAPVGFLWPFFDTCDFTEYPLFNNGPLHVNCSGSFDCNPVPVEPSTWGKVKSLYRD